MKILAVDLFNVAFPFFCVRPEDEKFTFRNTLKTIQECADDLGASNIIICTEGSAPSFRKAIFEGYKKNRGRPPVLFLDQVKQILAMADCKGWPVIDPGDCEADDALATIAARAGDEDEVFLMTRDKDLYACLNDRVKLVSRREGLNTIIAPKDCLAKFGIRPERMSEFLALVGDRIDEVPGVAGIGEVKAVSIINAYDSVHEAIQDPAKLKLPLAKSLILGRYDFNLSYQLTELRTDVYCDHLLGRC